MLEVEYKLKEKNNLGNDNPYKGVVKLKLLKFSERSRLIKIVNFKVESENQVVTLADKYESNACLAEIVNEYLISLEVYKGNKKFSSLEELDYDDDVVSFYTEVGMVLIKGVDLGNG